MGSEDFYKNINAFKGFSNIFDTEFHHEVPHDWYVILADIKGSTEAIRNGQYKDINVVGASCIIAVLNVIGDIDVPYVFGGDGASFLIPPVLIKDVAVVLSDVRDMAANVFGLELRVSAVSVAQAVVNGKTLSVCKYSISDKIYIAMFHGGGLAQAEKLIKADVNGDVYGLKRFTEGMPPKKADYTGLECRWNPVAARKDQIMTLMVVTRKGNEIYYNVMAEIERIFGSSENYTPVKSENLRLTLNAQNFKHEQGIQTYRQGRWACMRYWCKMFFECVLGMFLFKFNVTAAGVEGKKYVEDAAVNTDFQKFDDTLRVILDGTHQQSVKLLEYLNLCFENGDLFYGVSMSSSVMMTCLVFERTEKHLHFVDGMAGGYTMAAKAMKEQIAGVKQAGG